MNETYTLHVAGLTRELKKVRVAPNLRIASFVMLGDTRLIERCADALYEEIKKLGTIEMLVCPEAKGIPLTHALAVRMGVDYVVARKSVKGYMEHPIIAEVKSITTTETDHRHRRIRRRETQRQEGLRRRRRRLYGRLAAFARRGARENRLHGRQQSRRPARRGRLLEGRPHLSGEAAGL